MTAKEEVLHHILASITPGEWQELENGPGSLPVSDFNRATLLRLRDLDRLGGEVDAGRVELLRSRLEAYLLEWLPGKPDAHRFIVASCIGLAFVLCEPLHPIAPTGIRLRVRDGSATYYCPVREDHDGSLCEFCTCRDMGEWEARTLAIRE